MSERDDKWLEVLAGRRKADASSPDEREAEALRRIVQAEAEREAQRTDGEPDALLHRLETEGLLDAGTAPRRPRWLALAAAVAFVALALPLAYLTFEQTPTDVVDPFTRGGVEPVAVTVDAPAVTARALADDLGAAGLDVQLYEYEGAWIVDAEVPDDRAAAVATVLEHYGIETPAAGRVLLALSTPETAP